MRTFIAIDFPQKYLSKIAEITAYFRSQTPEGALKWVETDVLHLTIKFLGEISEQKLPEVKSLITSALENQIAFDICVESLGMYPNAKKPRVIWLGITHDEALVQTHQRLDQALRQVNIQPELRPFRPHLTIARVRRQTAPQTVKEIGETLSQFKVDSLGIVHVEEICLYQSTLTPTGPIYSPLLKIPLNQV